MTSTPSIVSPLGSRPGGHQIEVPGTLSRVMRRARVVDHMPCSSESMMPVATPVPTGRTMIAVAVARINMNSPKACRKIVTISPKLTMRIATKIRMPASAARGTWAKKRRVVTGHAKDKRDRREVRELAASTDLGHNPGQWRAGVDRKGAEEARHQISRADSGKVAIDGGGGARNRDERARRCGGLHHDCGDDDEGERRGLNEVREYDRGEVETRKLSWYLSQNRDAIAFKPKPIDRDSRRHDFQERAGNARADPFRANRHGEDSEPQPERNRIALAKLARDHEGFQQQSAFGSCYS